MLISSPGRNNDYEPRPPLRLGEADVLLVENDAGVRGCIAEMLGEAGLRVAEAASAPEALSLVRTVGLPPVLVTDLYLGRGMDGIALIATLRERADCLHAVLITGGEVAGDAADHCDTFLRKPFHEADLVRTIQSVREDAFWPC